MLFYLLHGHPLQALQYNALSMLVLPIVLYSLVRISFTSALPSLPKLSQRWLTAFSLAIILFTVARNIPVEPLCKLAPGGVCRTNTPKILSGPNTP